MTEKPGNGPDRMARSNLRSAILPSAVVIAALAVLAVVQSGWRFGNTDSAGDEGPRADWMFIDAGNADLVTEGRKVYEANCAECHGYGLEGQPNWQQRGPGGLLPAPPHDETGHTWHHPDAILFATVKRGGQAFMPQGVRSGMPGFGEILSDRHIEAALAFIKSRWPDEIRRQQETRNMQSMPRE